MESYLKKIAEVKKCSSALAALELMKTYSPEVIISDYHMPEMTGLEFIQELRSKNNLTPVILISGSHIQQEELTQFTDFLKKPVGPTDIINKVKKMLNL